MLFCIGGFFRKKKKKLERLRLIRKKEAKIFFVSELWIFFLIVYYFNLQFNSTFRVDDINLIESKIYDCYIRKNT